MGVQGLWTLLEPVGRRVNIEALCHKLLAVGEHSTVLMWVVSSIQLAGCAYQMVWCTCATNMAQA